MSKEKKVDWRDECKSYTKGFVNLEGDIFVEGEEKESPFLVEKSGSVSSPTSFLQRIDEMINAYINDGSSDEVKVLENVRSVFLLCLKELEKKKKKVYFDGGSDDIVYLSDVKLFFGEE